MNRRNDDPRPWPFFVRLLVAFAFVFFVSSQGACADDAQPQTIVVDSSATIMQLTEKLGELENRVNSLELQHLVCVADTQKLEAKLETLQTKVDPLVKTFPIVGTDTPDPNDNMVYVNGSLNLGQNDLLVRNIGASNITSDQATFSESWTMGVNHVESLALRQDSYERFMYGFDLQWIHEVSPFTLFGHDENGESVITFTSAHVRVNNLRAYNTLRVDTLRVDTFGELPELSVWNHLITNNLQTNTTEVTQLLTVKNEATFGLNDDTGPAVTITPNGLTSGLMIDSPSQINYGERMWFNRAMQLISFVQSNGDGTWGVTLEDAKLVVRRGMDVSNEYANQFNQQALVVRGDTDFKPASDGTPAEVMIEGGLNVTGAADTGCLQTEVDNCVDLQ